MSVTEWGWWASSDDEFFAIGPCQTREKVIENAVSDELGYRDDGGQSFYIAEAQQSPLRLADWIDADSVLERAEESLYDSDRVCSEYDDGPVFDCNFDAGQDLIARLKSACDEWQAAHGLTFKVNTFSAMRNRELIKLSESECQMIIANGSDAVGMGRRDASDV